MLATPNKVAKKGKDKNKDLMVLVYERLTEIDNSIATLTGRVDDLEKHLEELESMGDFEELHGEVQVAVNSVVVNVNKEVQAFRVSEATQKEELKTCRAKVEACKIRLRP